MRHFAHSIIAAAALIISITPARAATVQFMGYSHGSVGVNFQIYGPQPTGGATGAGGFLTVLNGVDPAFTTYCVDLYQYIGFNEPPYAYSNVPASAHLFRNGSAAADLARLYSSGHVIDSTVTEAAFQLAVWEIAYETSGAYKLDDGDARFGGSGADAVAALGLASDWLGHLSNGSSNGYSVRVLESGYNQDEVFATRIPEPGTLALALAALVAAVGVTRRRRDQAAAPS